MDLSEALRTRRSIGWPTGDSPSDVEVERLLELAMNVPDHAALRPWRLVLVRGVTRAVLGRALADANGGTEADRAKTAAKPLRAPLLIGVVFRPTGHAKVPEWEQLATASIVVGNLCLLLHSHGWAAMWRTGQLLDADEVRAAMRVTGTERLLGWLYVGRPDPGATCPPRPVLDPARHLTVLELDHAVPAAIVSVAPGR
jgi:nitroreductase